MAFIRVFSISLILLINCIFLYSCNTTEPDQNIQLSLSVEDISCTEVWLKLKAEGTGTTIVTISANDKPVRQLNLTNAGLDTIVFIDSLLPNQQYTFAAVSNNSDRKEVTARTMDTTSHDYTWETFQFGDYGSSLSDVAIINSSDIWAVGEIYMNGEMDVYNAVHWDGEKWEIKRISMNYNNSLIVPPLYSVYTFSDHEIWLSSGVPAKGDGLTWVQYHLFYMGVLDNNDGYLTSIWGNSSNDLYYAGTLGTIVHYTGQSWNKIESGTELNLYGIWGSETEILAVGSIIGTSQGRVILQIKDQAATPISSEGINNNLKSVWFSSGKAYYAATTDLFYKHNLSDPLWKECAGVTNYAITSVYGNEANDIFVSASYGDIIHFNGITWSSYFSQTNLSSGVFSKITAKGNIAAAIGFNGNKAVLTIGKRK